MVRNIGNLYTIRTYIIHKRIIDVIIIIPLQVCVALSLFIRFILKALIINISIVNIEDNNEIITNLKYTKHQN